MKHAILSLCLSLVLALPAAADDGGFDPGPFRYSRELHSDGEHADIGVVALDRDVFRETLPGFADVRLAKREGDSLRELPWRIDRVPGRQVDRGGQPLGIEILEFEENEDGSIATTIRVDRKDAIVGSLEIRTPLRDFEKGVAVSGSGDGESWTPLLEDAVVFDHSRFLDFRDTTLTLPETRHRFFRIEVRNATDEQRSRVRSLVRTFDGSGDLEFRESATLSTRPFRVDEWILRTPTRKEERLSSVSYEVEIVDASVDEEEKRSEILIDTAKAPIDTLVFRTGDRNFRRRVQVQVPRRGTEDEWHTIHDERIHRYEIGAVSDEDLEVSFSPSSWDHRSEKWRVLIENGDSEPLEIEGIDGIGEIYELRFFSESDEEFVLLYGAEERAVEKPDYDSAAIVAGRNEGVAEQRFQLGKPGESPGWAPHARYGSWLEQRWILWLAIAAAVAGLIVVLFRTARKLEPIE